MKKNMGMFALIGFLIHSSCTLYGRVGETPSQCDERYGEVLFKNTKGDMEFRTYKFGGKRIEVTFYKSESAVEHIVLGPRPYTRQEVDALLIESLQFLRGLLSEAYQFPEAELKQLLPEILDSSPVRATHGNVRAVGLYKADGQKAWVTAILSKELPPTVAEKLAEFGSESIRLEAKVAEKRKEGARAKGF